MPKSLFSASPRLFAPASLFSKRQRPPARAGARGAGPHSPRHPLFGSAFSTRRRRFAKAADLQDGIVWGFASVAEHGGKPVIDHDGDVISEDELVKAAHDFMLNSRVGGALHVYDPETRQPLEAGRVVESLVLSVPLQKALGIDLGFTPWVVGIKISDPTVRRMVASGALGAFSIGGTGRRDPIT